MRVSFDLDEVLFVAPQTHKTEPPLPFPLNSSMGRQYGFNVYQLDAEDDQWKEKIIERAEQIRKREFV